MDYIAIRGLIILDIFAQKWPNLELNGGNLIPSLQVSPRGPKTHTKSWRYDSLGRALKIGHTYFRRVLLAKNNVKSDFIYIVAMWGIKIGVF